MFAEIVLVLLHREWIVEGSVFKVHHQLDPVVAGLAAFEWRMQVVGPQSVVRGTNWAIAAILTHRIVFSSTWKLSL